MKCYNHHDQDAVGICKQCSKGICPDCVIDVGGGIACKATCAEAVSELNALIKANAAATTINLRKGGSYFLPMFLVGLGTIFLVEALRSNRSTEAMGFVVMSAAMFIGFGLLLALYQRAWRARAKG